MYGFAEGGLDDIRKVCGVHIIISLTNNFSHDIPNAASLIGISIVVSWMYC